MEIKQFGGKKILIGKNQWKAIKMSFSELKCNPIKVDKQWI